MAYNGVMNPKSENRERRQGNAAYRLATDTIVELKRGMDQERTRLIDELGMRWEGADEGMRSTLMTAHLLAGLCTWFLGLPEAVRNEILKEGLALYVARLDGDPKAPFQSPRWKDAKLRGVGGYTSGNTGYTAQSKRAHLAVDDEG